MQFKLQRKSGKYLKSIANWIMVFLVEVFLIGYGSYVVIIERIKFSDDGANVVIKGETAILIGSAFIAIGVYLLFHTIRDWKNRNKTEKTS